MQSSVHYDQENYDSGAHGIAEALKLSAFIALAGLVGLAPSAFYFKSPKLLFFFAAEGAVVGFLSLFSRIKRVSYGLGPAECLLAGLASVALWGFLGIAWLSTYGVIYWLARLVGLVVSRVANSADSIAFSISAVLCAIFAIGIALVIAENITRRYFSSAVSSRTAYYYRALRELKKTWLYTIASGIGLAVMGAILWKVRGQSGFWLYLVLQFIPYVASFWLVTLGTRARDDSQVFFAVVQLLKLAGYQTVISPHSENTIFDTVLAGVDLVAFNEKYAFIVKVKTRSGSVAPVEWTVGSSLKQKVRTLQFSDSSISYDLDYLTKRKLFPLVVVCGREPAQSLSEFSREENVPVVTLSMDVIDRVLEKDETEVKRLAAEHFSFLEQVAERPAHTLAEQGGN